MVVVDVTILNIALPTIGRELDASLPTLEWAVISYTITMIALVPTLGRLSDVFGRKRLYILGLAVFGGASALAGFSDTILTLIGARVLQAVGGALITSNTLAILTDVFPPGKRGVAMGIQAILISGGAAAGPVLGGFLVTSFGWEAVFFVNVPISIAASLVSWRVLPTLPASATRTTIDWAGASMLFIGLIGLLTAISRAPEWGIASAGVIAASLIGVTFSAAFVWRQLHTDYPIVKPALFRIRAVVAGLFSGLLATMTLVSMVFVLPFYWQVLRGETARMAGLLMLPIPLGIMTAAPLAGRLSDRIGSRGLTTGALLVVAVGAALMSQVDATTAIPDVLWRAAVLGLGLGTFMAPNNNAIMSAAPNSDRGVASGLLALFRFVGQSVGIVAAGTMLTHFAPAESLDTLLASHGLASEALVTPELGTSVLSPSGSTQQLAPSAVAIARDDFVRGFRMVCFTVIPLALLGAFVTSLRGAHPR
jgi:EmrB/QacA subfamily drug resistance transporter